MGVNIGIVDGVEVSKVDRDPAVNYSVNIACVKLIVVSGMVGYVNINT